MRPALDKRRDLLHLSLFFTELTTADGVQIRARTGCIPAPVGTGSNCLTLCTCVFRTSPLAPQFLPHCYPPSGRKAHTKVDDSCEQPSFLLLLYVQAFRIRRREVLEALGRGRKERDIHEQEHE